ncbi:MAG TPA: hypothetical protein PLU67_03335 [Candidatus Kapabacteria bacterium]|nr:hypothetical protein [Candidatus Kapabacteria bacterium]
MFENFNPNDEQLIAFQKRAEVYYNKASLFVIVDNDSYLASAEDLKQIKAQIKAIEDYRKSITDPINEQIKRIKAFFDVPINKLKEAEEVIKGAILKYQKEQERIRLEEQARLREEAEKRRLKLEQKAKKLEEQGKTEKAEEVKQQAETIITPILANDTVKVAGISKMKVWKYRITNESLIPREYLIPNEKMLTQIAKSTKGALKIPGVEFYCEETIAAKSL